MLLLELHPPGNVLVLYCNVDLSPSHDDDSTSRMLVIRLETVALRHPTQVDNDQQVSLFTTKEKKKSFSKRLCLQSRLVKLS